MTTIEDVHRLESELALERDNVRLLAADRDKWRRIAQGKCDAKTW